MNQDTSISSGDFDMRNEQNSPLVLALDDASTDLALVGGKGASLARMAAAGLPIPPGFHITTAAYRLFVARYGLQEQILAAVSMTSPDQPATCDTAAQTIATLFAQHPMPDEVAQAVRQAYVGLDGGDLPVAVRSSATAEDLPNLSFAGQQETYLNMRGEATRRGEPGRCGTGTGSCRCCWHHVYCQSYDW